MKKPELLSDGQWADVLRRKERLESICIRWRSFFYEERGTVLEEVTADSGYCSEKNFLYLKEQNIFSYIKLQDHEKRKTRAYQEDIGKYYNMKTQIFEDELYYVCHDGRELHHLRTETKEQAGYLQMFEVYEMFLIVAAANIKQKEI